MLGGVSSKGNTLEMRIVTLTGSVITQVSQVYGSNRLLYTPGTFLETGRGSTADPRGEEEEGGQQGGGGGVAWVGS